MRTGDETGADSSLCLPNCSTCASAARWTSLITTSTTKDSPSSSSSPVGVALALLTLLTLRAVVCLLLGVLPLAGTFDPWAD